MKKKFKKFIALSLCICMMAAMSISASAATVTPRNSYTAGVFYYWSPADSNQVLNIWGDETAYDTAPITLYAKESVNAQKFAIAFSEYDGLPRVYSKLGFAGNASSARGFTLNMNTESNPKCTLWAPTSSNPNRADSEIDYISNSGVLKLVNRTSSSGTVRVLTHSGEAVGVQRKDCSWIGYTNGLYSQMWSLTTN